jgi:SSS family solute:Na+ symporter
LILAAVSLTHPETLTERRESLIWKSFREPLQAKGWPGIGSYKILSALLASIMIALYIIFTFLI